MIKIINFFYFYFKINAPFIQIAKDYSNKKQKELFHYLKNNIRINNNYNFILSYDYKKHKIVYINLNKK